MNPFKSVEATVSLAVVVALVAGVGLAVRTVDQLADARQAVARSEACAAAVRGEPYKGRSAVPIEVCPPEIASAHAISSRSLACDQALGAKPENTFGVKASCTAAVKTLFAQRDTARDERDGFAGDLQRTRADQAAAISRAEARARTETERKVRAELAISRAPRDGDGLLVCDAQCLRDRFGPEAGAGRP